FLMQGCPNRKAPEKREWDRPGRNSTQCTVTCFARNFPCPYRRSTTCIAPINITHLSVCCLQATANKWEIADTMPLDNGSDLHFSFCNMHKS
uniref:Glycoprotein hormones alpha chain n=1 Tax=Coturnix japonica TaxID=93934 RepID=A0A8C2Y6L3_COTJA